MTKNKIKIDKLNLFLQLKWQEIKYMGVIPLLVVALIAIFAPLIIYAGGGGWYAGLGFFPIWVTVNLCCVLSDMKNDCNIKEMATAALVVTIIIFLINLAIISVGPK